MDSTPNITVVVPSADVSDNALRGDAVTEADAVRAVQIAAAALEPARADSQDGIAFLAAGILIANAIRSRRTP